VNYDEVLYLTDTGRRWDGDAVSIRDKAPDSYREGERQLATGETLNTKFSTLYAQRSMLFPRFHSTFDIINAAEEGKLPDKIMMTFHPQRWSDKPVPWVKELVWQNVKNVGKWVLVKAGKR
jgi:hypothetical protein